MRSWRRIARWGAIGLNALLAHVGLKLVHARALSAQAIVWPRTPIADDRVALRPFITEDVPDLVTACADGDVVFWAGWSTPFPRDEALHWVRGQSARRGAGEGLDLAIVDLQSGDMAGLIQLESVDWFNQRASIGVWLAPHARGRGLMTHALRLFVSWVFSELKLNRLEYLSLSDNTPALAVAERCGFVREGTLRGRLARHGSPRDAVLLSVLRDDWVRQGPVR